MESLTHLLGQETSFTTLDDLTQVIGRLWTEGFYDFNDTKRTVNPDGTILARFFSDGIEVGQAYVDLEAEVFTLALG